MAVIEKTWDVEARGIGRVDYSSGVEASAEPVISSWQSLYVYREVVIVPAGGSLVTDVQVELDRVVILYDFYASIPSNRVIRLSVETVDSLGATVFVIDRSGYQTIVAPLLRGFLFLNIIRFTTYNYEAVDEENMRIGCLGLYTTLEEYYIRIGDLPSP